MKGDLHSLLSARLNLHAQVWQQKGTVKFHEG